MKITVEYLGTNFGYVVILQTEYGVYQTITKDKKKIKEFVDRILEVKDA